MPEWKTWPYQVRLWRAKRRMPVCHCKVPGVGPWLHDEGCPVRADWLARQSADAFGPSPSTEPITEDHRGYVEFVGPGRWAWAYDSREGVESSREGAMREVNRIVSRREAPR